MVAVLALVAACGTAGTTSPPNATPFTSPAGGPARVIGTISAGPVCPVEKSPPDPQCAPRPVAGAVLVATNASGEEVGRTTSAADGTYELVITETGAALITAMPVAGLMGTPAPVSVTVTGPGEVQHLDLQYDTGIR
jgi:hypothetical protein